MMQIATRLDPCAGSRIAKKQDADFACAGTGRVGDEEGVSRGRSPAGGEKSPLLSPQVKSPVKHNYRRMA